MEVRFARPKFQFVISSSLKIKMEVNLGFNASSLFEFVKNKDGSELATFNGPSTCRVSYCGSERLSKVEGRG